MPKEIVYDLTMETQEILAQVKKYFGKNRTLLKETILSFKFDGKDHRKFQKEIRNLTEHPFDVSYLMFDDVIEWIKDGKIDEIDWEWLGDVSWCIDVLLNEDVKKGYDWDKTLAQKCGGTARILRFYLSDVLPFAVYDVFYMTYDKKGNYYEFGPITALSADEKNLLKKFKMHFQKNNYRFLDKKTALTRDAELISDCNSDGNATVFDALFCDTSNYRTEHIKFNDKTLKDKTGIDFNWKEYYNKDKKLIEREEYRYFPSKNVQCTVTNGVGEIIKVKVWRDYGKKRHQEFVLDLTEEIKKRKENKNRK